MKSGCPKTRFAAPISGVGVRGLSNSSTRLLFESAMRNHGVRVCGEWSYRTLLDDPRRLGDMSRAMLRLAHPHAADEIAEELIALAS